MNFPVGASQNHISRSLAITSAMTLTALTLSSSSTSLFEKFFTATTAYFYSHIGFPAKKKSPMVYGLTTAATTFLNYQYEFQKTYPVIKKVEEASQSIFKGLGSHLVGTFFTSALKDGFRRLHIDKNHGCILTNALMYLSAPFAINEFIRYFSLSQYSFYSFQNTITTITSLVALTFPFIFHPGKTVKSKN